MSWHSAISVCLMDIPSEVGHQARAHVKVKDAASSLGIINMFQHVSAGAPIVHLICRHLQQYLCVEFIVNWKPDSTAESQLRKV